MTYSAALLIPTAHRTTANLLGEQLGMGETNFSVALSADGSEPATHYGCRTHATEWLTGILADAQQGIWPDGVDPVPDVLDALIVDIRADAERHQHFDSVLATEGLQRVAVADPL